MLAAHFFCNDAPRNIAKRCPYISCLSQKHRLDAWIDFHDSEILAIFAPYNNYFMSTQSNIEKLDYVMMAISEFARHYGLTRKDAALYLALHKGIDFIDKHYEVEHTLSFSDCVSDMATVCRNNGGVLL